MEERNCTLEDIKVECKAYEDYSVDENGDPSHLIQRLDIENDDIIDWMCMPCGQIFYTWPDTQEHLKGSISKEKVKYRILLERSQCEFWTIDDQGDALDFDDICYDRHIGSKQYVVMDEHGQITQDFDLYKDAKDWVKAQENK